MQFVVVVIVIVGLILPFAFTFFRGMHVGKAGAKCKSFREYVHKCLNKLGLQDRISEVT